MEADDTYDIFNPFDDRSKKLMRQARNRRHYQKKKRYARARLQLASFHS